MKVCKLIGQHSYYDNRIFHKEAKSLKKEGYDVSILAPLDSEGYFLSPNLKRIDHIYPSDSFEEDGIKIYGYKKTFRPSNNTNSDIVRINVYKDFVRYIENDECGDLEIELINKGLELDADVYHAHELSTAYAAVKIKQIKANEGKRVRVIYDAHEYWSELYSKKVCEIHSFENDYKEIIKRLEKTILKFADATITVSEAIRGHLLQLNSKAFIEVVKNVPFYDHKNYIPKLNNTTPIICFEGAIVQSRRIDLMLNIISQIKEQFEDIKFLLVGDMFDLSIKEYMNNEIKRLKIEKNIIITGWVKPNESLEYIANCDIGLLILEDIPQYHFSLANKIFNYMRGGLAIITNDFPEQRRIVQKEKAGLLVNSDVVNLWVDEILKLMNNEELLLKYRTNARKIYELKYNWQEEEKTLFYVYNTILDKY